MVLREQAYAKVNLYLHLTGRRADGYHLLDSLTGFITASDRLEAVAAEKLTLTLEGPYAAAVPSEDNLVLKAARLLHARLALGAPGAALTLHKHLPVAAGIGGGSADAAAALRLLTRFWDVKLSLAELDELALALGADVPACLKNRTLYMSGIGEALKEGPELTGMPIVLANAGQPLKTAEVFAAFASGFSTPARHPKEFASVRACAEFLAKCRNDLQEAAIKRMPAISTVLEALAAQQDCLLARMSGSGATCFALFEDKATADAAARRLSENHPSWWVKQASFL
jgi:4-diphosphocytidyl-2-C-methyl-D-erythritol kinase